MKFAFVYHGGAHPQTPEETERVMDAWRKWLAGMGDAVADVGNPVGMSCTVHPDGSVTRDGGSNPVAGMSFIIAEGEDAAIAHARCCPILASGGSVEVAPVIDLDLSAESSA